MATKKAAAKKSTAKKSAVKAPADKKSAAKKTAPEKTVAKKSAPQTSPAKKTAAKKSAVKKTAAKKGASTRTAASRAKDDNYTKPDLREHIKEEVMAGDKGGRPGQWSARKAQMVAHEYVAEGGAYKHPKNEAQQHLTQWGDEHWHTADGKTAIQGDTTHRYLPDKAWKELTPEEQKATDAKKVRGSRKGKQFVANTDKAKDARHQATAKGNEE